MKSRVQLLYFLPTILGVLIIGYASLVESSNLPKIQISCLDKGFHFIVYFFLTIVFLYGIYRFNFCKKLTVRMLVFVFTLVMLFGVSMEIAQFYFSTSRHFEIPDIMTNIIGSLTGVILFKNHFK